MRTTLIPFAAAMLAAIHAFGQSGGTVVLDETFSDGDLAGGADPLDAIWYLGSGATAAVVDDTGGLAAGNALQYVSTGNFSRVTGVFDAPIAIPEAGDKITVEFRLRMTRFSAANDGGIRFGLHHDNGEPITMDNVGQSWTDLTDGWDGYFFRGGVGGTNGMRIYKDVPVAGNSAMGGSGDTTVGNGTGWTLNDADVHAGRIEVVRTENGQNLLRFFWDDDLKVEVPTATAGGEMSAFTNFTLGSGSTEIDLLVDDIRITLSQEDAEPVEPIDLEARLIDWTRAGVEGGIPDYANVIDFVEAGGDPTGVTNNSPLLQSLINAQTGDTVIYFAAGVYRFNRRVNFVSTATSDRPGIILRGAGTRNTKLLFMDPVAEDAGLFDVSGADIAAPVPIESGLTKGSTTITLQSVGNVTVGRWLWIQQDNDADTMATTRNIPDYLDTINNSTGWAARVVGQIVKVTAIAGNEVTLDRPLHLDFTWPNPTATPVHMIEGVGFEDFTLENGLDSANRINFDFARAANCWIRNVHSLMAMRFHVGTLACANLTIRDSYFNDAWRHDGGGHGYGTLIADTSTHCLIENNVFRNLRHAMIWKEGATGNVFAYNYSTDGNQSDAAVAKDISGHGHYAFANLIEGNIAQFIHASDYWGPIGPNNMFLRNRVTQERILIEDNTKDQNVIGNELVSPTVPFVVVDSSSTGAYMHGNNEGGVIQWRPDEAEVVPDSYMYAAEPAFWDIADPWPSIGPEYTAGANTIPAKYRWDNGLMDLFVPAPLIQEQPSSAVVNAGEPVLLTVDADVEGAATYQWQKDGVDLVDGGHVSGATTASLFLSSTSPADVGAYTLTITSEGGSVTSAPALVALWNPDDGTLSNLSTRGQVFPDDGLMIAGFVVAGESPKTLLIRGVGPTMEQFVGAGLALEDSVLAVFSDGAEILGNDDWGTSPDAEAIRMLSEAVGAFPLETASKDAAIRADLPPGAYSVHLSGKGGSGLALAELYDGSTGGDSRLVNISTRGWVGTGDALMVPGIVITGNPRRLLVRGVGPELAASFGIPANRVLSDPVLTLKDEDGVTLASNDEWSAGPDALTIIVVSQQVGAFPLTVGSADAALLVEAPAGIYTAQVSGADGGEGVAIVEAYAVP